MSTIQLRDLPPDLQDRYGYRRTPALVIVIVAIVVLVLSGLAILLATRIANPDVTYKLLAWQAVSDDHTDVTFEVSRSDKDSTQCVLRVQDRSHQDLGYAIVTIPAGTSYEKQTYSVGTRARGFSADVIACAANGPPTNAPSPDFPPGTSNPTQPWRPS